MTNGEETRDTAEQGSDARSSRVDERMAELLTSDLRTSSDVRRSLEEEGSAESEDLLARLNALDYLDTVVGEVGGALPERLGDFRIVGLLGRGGMGTVFEAFQESLERVVALKVLAPSLTSDPRMRKRFRSEARASATLHHQHIVPVYGFGEANGHLYFAMERVDGVSLDKHIAAARHRGEPVMEPRAAARRFAGVADALTHAHRRGILHRDVKPGNILVHPDGSLALADFGLSKMVGEQSMSVSRHGGFLGTLHYAAPEQARGRPVTPASDLYSLGVTIYECVTGQLPIQGETTESLLQSLINDTPRTLRQLMPRAPRDLELVVEKLLSKEPEDRYADGETLARDLVRVADDEPVQVRRRPLAVRAWRRIRKHRMLSAAVAVSFLLLLTVFVLWRQVVGEERAARLSRHATQLALAVSTAETEPGRLDGPDGVLEALVGVDLPEGDSGSDVVAHLDGAERDLPAQARTRALRAAYLDDPVPDATSALRQGLGRTALDLLDAEIEDAESRGFVERDSVTWLRLYRLYLSRAVARLTAAVADPAGAGDDLLRASFVRPGAFVPALLSIVVDWSPSSGVDPLFARLDGLLRDGPEGSARVVGELLRAIAARDRAPDAHILPLDLPYPVRRELLSRATRYAGPGAGKSGATRLAGRLETALEEIARAAAVALADVPKLRAALARGRGLLEREVAETSPLQSWRVAYGLLDAGDPTAVQLPGGEPLPAAIQVRGIEDFLALGVPTEVVRVSRPAIEQALTLAETAGAQVDRARSALAQRVGDIDGAFRSATRWIDRSAADPDAYLARLRCRIDRGELDWAAFDGAQVVGLSIDADAARRAVIALLEDAAGRDVAAEARWRELAASFGPGG